MRKKTLLIIGAGEEQKLVVKKGKKMGLFVVVLDMNSKAPAVKLADDFIQASAYHPLESIKKIISYNKKRRINGVIAACIDAPHTAAEVAERLKLNSYTKKTAKIAVNKFLMKKAFIENKILTPKYYQISNLKQLNEIYNINKNLVIKPQDSRGGRGVIQLRKAKSLEWAYETATNLSPTKKVVVEEFLTGPQLSTESFIYQGKIYTPGLIDRNYEYIDKFAPYFIENGGEQPTRLSSRMIENVNQIILKTANSIGIKEGFIKGDLVIHKDKIYVIEVAARLSGGYMSTVQIPQATGVDFLKVAIKFVLNEKIDPQKDLMPKFQKGMAIRFWFPKPGKLKSISGLKTLRNLPGVIYYGIYAKIGQIIEPPTDLTKRVGFVICEGKNRTEAIKNTLYAIKSVKFITI